MAYRPFYEEFPTVAEQETRAITIAPGERSRLPVGEYGFVEMFCDEPGCDCRRVFFSVLSSTRHQIEAVVAWGWEKPEFYATWMNTRNPRVVAELKGPVLNVGSPATALAPALLELTRTVLLRDPHYVERIKRHYQMFRQRIEGGRPVTGPPRTERPAKKLDLPSARTAPVDVAYRPARRLPKTKPHVRPARRDDCPRARTGIPPKPSLPFAAETPPGAAFSHYEITTEPMPEPHYQRLPQRVKEEIERLHDIVQRRPREAIPALQDLITRYPRVPQLYNYLSVAHARAGQRREAEAVVEENYRRNPEYVFARVNYAEVCLARGDYAQVAEIFAHTFDLSLLYPQRKRFHLSEVANFMGLAGLYFLATGNRELAEHYDTFLQQIAPEFPMTRRLHKTLFPVIIYLTHLCFRESKEVSYLSTHCV